MSLSLNTKSFSPRQRRGLLCLLSFAVPFFVLTLACLGLLITPFGKHNLAITDGRYYINNLMFLGRLLKGQENLLYSFKNGLGGNEWSLLAWGGFSVGGLLSVFMTLENVHTLFTWVCIINMSICGVSMYALLAHLRGHRLDNLIFSTAYALMGFNVVYCYHYLFFIGPQMLPLMVLGLWKLEKGKSPLLYVISLAFCILLNFYFGFMLCIASVLLFAALLYLNQDELTGKLRKRYWVYMASSAIAGLLPAFFWLPALKAYSGGGRLNQTGLNEYQFSENMPFIQIFSKLFSGAISQNEEISGLPNIFCGILVLALVVLFFLNKRIPVRRRRVAGLLLGFYLLTFYITAFTIAMHGGTHTNWFPYRYSFVFTFLLVGIAAEQYGYVKETTLEETKQCGTLLLLGTILVFSTRYEFITGGSVVADFALLLLMWLGFYLYKTKPEQAPLRTLSILLLVVSCANLYANFSQSIYRLRDWEKDTVEYNNNMVIYSALIDGLNQKETDFFRMEKDVSESSSVGADPYLYSYNGVSHSGPGEREFVHKGLCRIGVNWFNMRHWYSEGIPAATDSLLGLQYMISSHDLTEEKGYEKMVNLEGQSIFKNHNALPIAILSDGRVGQITLGNDVFQNLNTVWRSMTGETENPFSEQDDVTFTLYNDFSTQPVTSKELKESVAAESVRNEKGKEQSDNSSPEEESNTNQQNEQSDSYFRYTFTAEQDGPVYMYDTSVPDSEDGRSIPAIKLVGTYRKGDTVEGTIPVSEGIGTGKIMRGYCANLVFAYADNGVLDRYADKLNARDITFHVEHENQLNGTFTAEKNQRILFTIPWDEGWTCYIDGEKVPIDKTWDLFMSVEVPEGAHTWEMKFFPAWMDYGLMLSGAALVGLVVLMVLWKRSKNNRMVSVNHCR